MICPSCGFENAEGAKFCSECGTALTAAAPQREERKVVTVLFADLVGFTATAEKLDPEEVRALLQPYHAQVREILERHDGTVEKFIGDAVMAVFGAPVAHEDDPERAVRAALAIRDGIVEEGKLSVRIGITTGEALVALGARPEAGEGMASGDVVNTAARLQSAAPVDAILVDATTFHATERAIEYREHEPVVAKGKSEPVPVWEAVQARARFGTDVRQIGRAALVAREKELEVLRNALARATGEREPQLVTLVGVPGIGKSRLVWELVQEVDASPEFVTWRQGRSLPYGEGVSFWALSEMVKAHAGILETDAPAEAERKLREFVPDSWVGSHLRPLVGLGADPELGGDRRAEAFAAWRRFFEALAEEGPLVLVFEDLHWADDGLLDFVDHLVDWASGVPLLVVGTARPELLARRPGWGGGKPNALTLSLSPLSDEETARLVHVLLDRSVLPAEVQSTLLERAGGNPLYAEEFVRLLEERRGDVALPESVQGIIAARLDSLSPEEKGLLQEAAVLGKVFWLGGLRAERWRAEELLHALERKEFVRRERRSSVAGETEYAFRHTLVRDVAYDQIPHAERGERHGRAAGWIESLGRSEDHAEMLAQHYLAALEYAPADGALLERARPALREAGDRAFSLNAFGQAARFYERALHLVSDPELSFRHAHALYLAGADASGEALARAGEELLAAGERGRAAEANALLAELWWHRGSPDRSLAYQGRAAELIADAPPSAAKARVLAEVSRFRVLAGHPEEGLALAREAFAMAEALGLTELAARALNNIGVGKDRLGDPTGLTDVERSIELALSVNSPEAARGYNNLGALLWDAGDADGSAESLAEALRTGERLGNAIVARYARGILVGTVYWRGDWDETLHRAEAFIAECEAGSSHYMEPHVRLVRADLLVGRGESEERILDDTAKALAKAREIKDPQTLVPALCDAAHVYAGLGRRDEGRAALAEMVAAEAKSGLGLIQAAFVAKELGMGEELCAFAEREAPSAWRDAIDALLAEDYERAADVFEAKSLFTPAAEARLRAAGRLVAEGRRAEADVQLRKALAFWRSVGATRYIRQGEALLAVAG